MKKLLILCLIMFLSGCAKENPDIQIIVYDMGDPYMNQFAEDIISSNKSDYIFKVKDSENNQLLQNELIQNALDLKPKVILINPVDRLGSYTIINKAKETNTPIIFFNREPLAEDLDLSNNVYYVGAPAANSAKIQAEIVFDAFGDPNNLSSYDKNDDGIIQLIILKGEQGHQDAETRTSVIIDELERLGYQLEILAIQIADWNTAIAYEKMIDLVEIHGENIELVISNNDAMAIGAISALSEKSMFNDINENGVFDKDVDLFLPVIGIDGISQAIRLIKEGYLYGTVLNDSKAMAKVIVELAEALANGSDLNNLDFDIIDGKYIWVDYQKYTPEID